jgi:adenine-specific DNA-methyltransferase
LAPQLDDGFDVVIGNPPYVQIQKFSAAHKQAWQGQRYSTYSATGDVYCLFYERGVRLLKAGGQLCYITSNKWMRAAYGEKLRDFFAKEVAVEEVIDFGGVVVFNAAMVDTAIVRLGKRAPSDFFPSAVLSRNFSLQQSLTDYMRDNAVPFKRPANGADSWVVMAPERYRIKQGVEAQGVPLEKWHIQINRGILTGYNEAFYITTDQRNDLTAEDPRCTELIVPLLRGRDIQRYGTDWPLLDDEKWLINTHNGIKDQGIPPINAQRDYPPIWRRLKQHQPKLEPRLDQGDHWSNLRNCAYLDEFKKHKIIYPEITKYINFYFDADGNFYPNNKAFILTTEDESLPYLTAVLNSTLFRCSFIDNFPNLGEDRRELRKIFMDKVPIKKPDAQQAALFETLVPLVQAAKAVALTSSDQRLALVADFLVEVIDACVMEVYFAQHMAEKGLGITDHVRSLLPDNVADLSQAQLAEAALTFHQIANDSQHPIRNILLRIPADSPDLLAVIQKEGAV